uniref:Uncharacterized protein n=1 Tax=Globodera pallida TaxID=36090 RepID=A0A183BY46_GLOPA
MKSHFCLLFILILSVALATFTASQEEVKKRQVLGAHGTGGGNADGLAGRRRRQIGARGTVQGDGVILWKA